MKNWKTYFLAGLIALSGFSCTKQSSNRPNIMILLIDTLRADHLADYGYYRLTDPFLSEFGKRGIRFARAYSQSSHTKVATTSLFTGLLPPFHKVRRAGHPSLENKNRIMSDVLSEDLITLPEVLKKAGYITGAFVTNPHLRPFFGFDQGFDTYQYLDSSTRAEVLNNTVLRWLRRQPKNRPFFVYVHYMDVHEPYNPPREYTTLYINEMVKMVKIYQFNGPWRWKEPPDKKSIYYTIALYDAQINYWDDCFKRFISQLENEGFLKNTLLIIIADHGEEFYEHGGFGHGYTLYEEQLHIPLYMFFEDVIQPNQIWDDMVQTVDIFPTVCYFAKIDCSDLKLFGQNIFDKNREKDLFVYSETYRGVVPRSIRTDRYKVIFRALVQEREVFTLKKSFKELLMAENILSSMTSKPTPKKK